VIGDTHTHTHARGSRSGGGEEEGREEEGDDGEIDVDVLDRYMENLSDRILCELSTLRTVFDKVSARV